MLQTIVDDVENEMEVEAHDLRQIQQRVTEIQKLELSKMVSDVTTDASTLNDDDTIVEIPDGEVNDAPSVEEEYDTQDIDDYLNGTEATQEIEDLKPEGKVLVQNGELIPEPEVEEDVDEEDGEEEEIGEMPVEFEQENASDEQPQSEEQQDDSETIVGDQHENSEFIVEPVAVDDPSKEE